MKKLAMLVMLVCIVCTMGNKGCDKNQTEEMIIVAAGKAVQESWPFLKAAADRACLNGRWSDEDCELWNNNEVCLQSATEDLFLRFLRKAFDEMTPAERERLIRIASGK